VDQGERRLSRRDLAKRAAKVGAAGAVVVWVAPHFEDVAYAAGSTGSPPPESTTTSRGGTHPGPAYPTCQGDPRVFFNLPHSIHVWGSGWAPSSKITVTLVGVKVLGTITVGPDGKFDAHFTVPAGLFADELYRISFSGFGKNGHPYKCGVAIFVDQKCMGAIAKPGSKTTSKKPIATSGGGSGPAKKKGSALGARNAKPRSGTGAAAEGVGGDSKLPFSGADSRAVVLVGAGAVIAGKTLYSLRNRVAAAADGDLALH
jgi:hypothetical protein